MYLNIRGLVLENNPLLYKYIFLYTFMKKYYSLRDSVKKDIPSKKVQENSIEISDKLLKENILEEKKNM